MLPRIRGARYKTTPRSARPNPARQPNPFSDQARHAPLLRANSYSEITNPIWRFPLPTIIYWLEAVYLGDLLRVRTGATPPRGLFLDFQGQTPPQLQYSSCSKLYLPAREGTRTLIQKRKLFLDLPMASLSHFGLLRRTFLRGSEWYAVPLLDSGIGTEFPFTQWMCFWFHISIFIYLCIILGYFIYIGFLLGFKIDHLCASVVLFKLNWLTIVDNLLLRI